MFPTLQQQEQQVVNRLHLESTTFASAGWQLRALTVHSLVVSGAGTDWLDLVKTAVVSLEGRRVSHNPSRACIAVELCLCN